MNLGFGQIVSQMQSENWHHSRNCRYWCLHSSTSRWHIISQLTDFMLKWTTNHCNVWAPQSELFVLCKLNREQFIWSSTHRHTLTCVHFSWKFLQTCCYLLRFCLVFSFAAEGQNFHLACILIQANVVSQFLVACSTKGRKDNPVTLSCFLSVSHKN